MADPWRIAWLLWGLGHAARRQTEYAEARALHEESLASRRALGEEATAPAREAGRAMSLEQAISYALKGEA